MNVIEVKIPQILDRSYKVHIAAGSLSSLAEKIRADFPSLNPFVVTDQNLVSAGHLEILLAGNDWPSFVINPPGENSKNISTVVEIIESMEKAFLGRDTIVIALGGGTVGDIAAFAASIFKRAVPVVHIPTTTLSQADSSIGGKTGVDSTLSKNAFGTFFHPAAVYIDVDTLKTLDDLQYKAGIVEWVKHALIADEKFFKYLEDNLGQILNRDSDTLQQCALFNCRIKASVVEVDPEEKNQRRMLNYGHTIGHAAESVSNFELLHGQAVAIGIIAANIIEAKLGLAEPQRLDRIKAMLKKLGMPIALPPKIDKTAVFEAIKRDKKAVNQWPKFVLIDKIGQVHTENGRFAIDVSVDIVNEVLKNL